MFQDMWPLPSCFHTVVLCADRVVMILVSEEVEVSPPWTGFLSFFSDGKKEVPKCAVFPGGKGNEMLSRDQGGSGLNRGCCICSVRSGSHVDLCQSSFRKMTRWEIGNSAELKNDREERSWKFCFSSCLTALGAERQGRRGGVEGKFSLVCWF